jgi:hypothetical protein
MNAEKLTIINAHYYIPDQNNYNEKLVDFMRLMLTPNPADRPTAKTVLGYIQKWDQIDRINLSSEVMEIKKKQMKNNEPEGRANTKLNLLTDEEIKRIQEDLLKKASKGGKRKRKYKVNLY